MKLKKKKQNYYSGQLLKIEQCLTDDPNKFWKYVKNLGPKSKQSIPMEVIVDGQIVTEESEVLQKWKSDFEQLYQANNTNMFDDNFRDSVLKELQSKMSAKCGSVDSNQDPLNRKISRDELKTVIDKTKNNKAVGLDEISNELLKHELIQQLLCCLFNVCKDLNMVPSVWHKAIIHPIPKSNTVSRNPLNYRGLALQCSMFKIFCSVMNN